MARCFGILRGLGQAISALIGIALIGFGLTAMNSSQPGGVGMGAIMIVVGLLAAAVVVLMSPPHHRRSTTLYLAIGGPSLMCAGGVILPVFFAAKAMQPRADCMANLKSYGAAMTIYLNGNDDRFPPSSRWHSVLSLPRGKQLVCPEAKTPFSYAMNQGLSGVALSLVDEPARTVLFFEMDAHEANAHGGRLDVAHRHGASSVVWLVDGHVGVLNARLGWSPDSTLLGPSKSPPR